MNCYVGIDLGSTTTKSVVMDDGGMVLGRGITNSRSNYDTAAAVSKQEALIDARFTLFRRGLERAAEISPDLIDAYLQAAAAFEAMGNHAKAVEMLSRYGEASRKHAEPGR